MADWGRVDFSELEELQKRLDKLIEQKDAFYEDCAKEIAARLLAKVIKRTPVGKYGSYKVVTARRTTKNHTKGEQYQKFVKDKSGKVGGTLRRGWTGGSNRNAADYANSLNVVHTGRTFEVTVSNPIEYASYVEYGHRQTPGRYVPAIGKRLKSGWVKGTFMLTFSEQELQSAVPGILKKKINAFLKECFG